MSEIIVTFTGTVGIEGDLTIDQQGYFGAAGGNITGDPFTAVWQFNVPDLGGYTSGGSVFYTLSPLIGAELTINGHSVAFGQTGLYGVAIEGNYHDDVLNQDGTVIYVNATDYPGQYAMNNFVYTPSFQIPTQLIQPFSYTLNPAIDNSVYGGIGGSVELPGNAEEFLTVSSVSVALDPRSVPAPVLGSEWPGLLIMVAMMVWWAKRRRAI